MSFPRDNRAFSIRIFLADGVAEGLWVVEKSNWTGVALSYPRSIYTSARKREELGRAGVYVLVGPADNAQGRDRVYVGEAEVVRERMDGHHAQKDFWTRAVVFTSKDGSLNKAHVRYLESRLIALAKTAQRVEIDNGNAPQLPALSEADIADMETFLEEMLLLYPVLDVRAFETIANKGEASRPRLFVQGLNGAHGEGIETAEGFLVFAGSGARTEAVPSLPSHVKELRMELAATGVLHEQDGVLVFTKDFLFNSPSTAAGVIVAQSVNGRTAWKDGEGRTLKELQTALVS